MIIMTTTFNPASEAQPRRERGLLMRLVDDIFLEVPFRVGVNGRWGAVSVDAPWDLHGTGRFPYIYIL